MDDPQGNATVLKIFLDFLSANLITICVTIVLLTLLFICKEAISNLISRITLLSIKNGKSELGLNAYSPVSEYGGEKVSGTKEEKPSREEMEKKPETSSARNAGHWLLEVEQAFEDGRLEDADAEFKRYELNENDSIKLEMNKAYYLFLKFEKGKDNGAIKELEQLSKRIKNEDTKFEALKWLSVCFEVSMQYDRESKMWESALTETISEDLKTKILIQLSYSLNREGCSAKARDVLTKLLVITKDDEKLASIYEALSKTEGALGNTSMAIYCKDKSMEYDLNNRDELFNSAFAASEEDFDAISISNYVKLVRIDENNSTALNNLGVKAQEAGLKIKAVKEFKRSSELENTLSMANQGYLLLEAGFADEAEKIAKEALNKDALHQNVYSLISSINEQKEKQQVDWEALVQNSFSKQKQIREYTEQYYLGDKKSLEGDWFANGKYQTTIKIHDGSIEVKWIEASQGLGGNSIIAVLMLGKVSGSTINGVYSRKRNEATPSTLLGLGFAEVGSRNFISFMSENKDRIIFLPQDPKDQFNFFMSRMMLSES